MLLKRWSIARTFFVGQLLFMVVLTVFIATAVFVDAREQNFRRAEQRMLTVGTAIAESPMVLEAVNGPDPGRVLQPYTLDVLHSTDLDFITIMAPNGRRYTHPNPAEIGKPYSGSISEAVEGRPYTEVATGTLGPSVRSIVPVKDDDGTVRAMVATGVTLSNLDIALNARLPAVIGLAAGVIGISAVAAYLLSGFLRRATLGLGPEELARVFVFHRSVLHHIREGVLLLDRRRRLVLYNDQAARLLKLPAPGSVQDPVPAGSLDLPESLKNLLVTATEATDDVHVTEDRILVVSQQPAYAGPEAEPGGRAPRLLGSVVLLRDRTELETLSGEVESMQTLTEALKAQTHEHSNRLHTIVSLLELGRTREALDFAARDLQQSQRLTDEFVASVDIPYVTALLVGKAAQANERGIELSITADADGGRHGASADLDPAELVTIVGNLLDNAFDAAAASEERSVAIDFYAANGCQVIEVADSGPGIDASLAGRIFDLGTSSKEPGMHGRGIGLALVRQAVNRLGGTVSVDTTHGTVFTVRLPLTDRQSPAEPKASHE